MIVTSSLFEAVLKLKEMFAEIETERVENFKI